MADPVMEGKLKAEIKGPPRLREFAHVSVPCRDLKEGKRFYARVLGGEMHVETPTFASQAWMSGSASMAVRSSKRAPSIRTSLFTPARTKC